MKSLFTTTWTVPEFDGIITIFNEKFPEFAGN